MLTIYTKNGCAQCHDLRFKFERKNIGYNLKVLDEDFTVIEIKRLFPNARSFPIVTDEYGKEMTMNEVEEFIDAF